MIGETIFYNTQLDSPINQQNAKIAYLQDENKFLQDHIKDLEQVVHINKEALRLLAAQCNQIGSRSKIGSENDTTTSIMENRNSPGNNKSFNVVYEQMLEENTQLLNMIEKLKRDRAEAQSRALLSEQIAEEAERHEAETRAEWEEKVFEMRKKLQDKEFFIQELEKLKPIPDQEGVVIKYREVMDVTEQNLKLHEELISYKAMLVKVAKAYNKLQEEKADLNEANTKLMSELMKLKAVMANPVTPRGGLKLFDKFKDALNKSHFKNTSQSGSPLRLHDENSPTIISPKTKKCDAHTLKPSLFKQEKHHENPMTSKPSSYQATNVYYDMKLLEKINQLESELELTKNILTRESMNNKSLSDEVCRLRRGCQEVIATNEILCKSNKKHQEKSEKLFHAVEFYKEFYHKYIDLITSRKAMLRSATADIANAENLKKVSEALDLELELDSIHIKRKTSSKIEIPQEEENIPKQEEEAHEQQNDKEKGLYKFTKEQSKIYLLELAKGLTVNITKPLQTPSNKHMRSKREGRFLNRPKRVKRSLSNPLDYVLERKDQIYDPLSENKEEAIQIRKCKRARTREEWKRLETQKIAESFEAGLQIEEPYPLRVRRSVLRSSKKGHDNHTSFSVGSEDFEGVQGSESSFISTDEIFEI